MKNKSPRLKYWMLVQMPGVIWMRTQEIFIKFIAASNSKRKKFVAYVLFWFNLQYLLSDVRMSASLFIKCFYYFNRQQNFQDFMKNWKDEKGQVKNILPILSTLKQVKLPIFFDNAFDWSVWTISIYAQRYEPNVIIPCDSLSGLMQIRITLDRYKQ